MVLFRKQHCLKFFHRRYDLICTRIMQFLPSPKAKGDTDTSHAERMRAFHIMQTVTNQHSPVTVHNVQLRQRLLQHLSLGADRAIQRCAGNHIEKNINLKKPQNFLDKNGRLGRRNRDLFSSCTNCTKQIRHTGKQNVFLPALFHQSAPDNVQLPASPVRRKTHSNGETHHAAVAR